MNKFPITDGPAIEWAEAIKIYKIYRCIFPSAARIQSLERIAERGGFSTKEIKLLRWKHDQIHCHCHEY